MNCMSCLGVVVRLNSFRGFNLAPINPKDGYAVVDCKEPRARRVLEFLVPLLYPEKPTRVTICENAI